MLRPTEDDGSTAAEPPLIGLRRKPKNVEQTEKMLRLKDAVTAIVVG